MADLLELIHQMLESGLTWATGVSVVLLYMKWQEAKKKKAAYDRMERKIDAIGEKVGYGWNGQANEYETDPLSYKRWQRSYSAVISQAGFLYQRRGRRMNQTINFSVLFLAIAGAIKLILQPFGIDLTGVTDDQINAIANAVGAIFAIVGIIRNNVHKKGEANSGSNAQRPTDSNSAV